MYLGSVFLAGLFLISSRLNLDTFAKWIDGLGIVLLARDKGALHKHDSDEHNGLYDCI